MEKETIQGIPAFLTHLWESHDEAMLFRGQPKAWPLLPRISRWPEALKGSENWRVFQEVVLNDFAKFASPYLPNPPIDELDWLIQAQHHGVPTKLLDFSLNPLKALFFAVAEEKYDSDDGAFWAVSPQSWSEDFRKTEKLSDDRLDVYLPRQTNHRIIAQESCFISFPLPENQNPLIPLDRPGAYQGDMKRLQQLVVPASSKRQIRIELSTLGVRYRSLFPDLVGVASDIVAQLNLAEALSTFPE